MLTGVVRINPRFENLLPPLKEDEFMSLKRSLIEEGCREPITIWNNWIVDGHNRFNICNDLEIDFEYREMDFDGEDDAIVWMIDNQGGRRNLSDGWKYDLALKKKEILLAKGREKQKETLKQFSGLPNDSECPVLSIIDKTDDADDSEAFEDEPYNTRKTIAADLGWGTCKTAQADYVFKHGDDKIKEKVKRGDASIYGAYKEVKKKVQAKEREDVREKIAQKATVMLPSDKFEIICGDIRDVQLDRQFDYIVTDPPYPREYLELWGDLGRRAKEWLKPGGLLIAMSGQSYLPDIYSMLCENLEYYWTAAYLTPGQPTPLRHVNVNTTWKPLLIFRNGDYSGKIFGDVTKSDGNDKSVHHWGQSVSGMSDIIKTFTIEGSAILDPFCGAGTTGVAAVSNNRIFCGIDIDEKNVKVTTGRINEIIGA